VLTYIAVPITGVDLPPCHLAMALAALLPFCLLFGTLALLFSALVRRAALSTVIPAVILIAMYVIQTLSQVSKTMEPTRVVSLFYHLGDPVQGDFPWTAVLLMLAGVCALTGVATAAFSRRDLYT
jgi:ABC-type transport system involved in multi-copper enzyme maturation permease subunit